MDARIEAFELAFRMHTAAPQVMDLAGETQQTLNLYGIDQGPPDNFGRQCLMARRLSESGVRFVQCTHSYKWDQHGDIKGGHTRNAAATAKVPIGPEP